MNADTIIKMACSGNEPAERFCRSWVSFCHVIDELHDRDHQPISDAVMVTAFINYTVELAGNPFFQSFKAQLIGLMVQSANAWLDSNQREGTERHVLAGFYHEVVFHCAFLTGGWAHLRRVTQECREYKEAKC